MKNKKEMNCKRKRNRKRKSRNLNQSKRKTWKDNLSKSKYTKLMIRGKKEGNRKTLQKANYKCRLQSKGLKVLLTVTKPKNSQVRRKRTKNSRRRLKTTKRVLNKIIKEKSQPNKSRVLKGENLQISFKFKQKPKTKTNPITANKKSMLSSKQEKGLLL